MRECGVICAGLLKNISSLSSILNETRNIRTNAYKQRQMHSWLKIRGKMFNLDFSYISESIKNIDFI